MSQATETASGFKVVSARHARALIRRAQLVLVETGVGKVKITKQEARRHLWDGSKVEVMIGGFDNTTVCLFGRVA
jgi:hypothetical protein